MAGALNRFMAPILLVIISGDFGSFGSFGSIRSFKDFSILLRGHVKIHHSLPLLAASGRHDLAAFCNHLI